jgi:hypothetical protein
MDPRAVIVPILPGLRALAVKDVPDGEDWLEGLLCVLEDENAPTTRRFPSLQYLSLPNTQLFTFPLPDGYTSEALTHLDVSANLLNALPATLAQLTALQSLNIRTNLVTSVRNAVKLVPHVRALNLRENKIDCLAGLDALRDLQRVDVRQNTIYDVDELSRLAVLPSLREVWAAGNPFTTDEENDDARWKVRVWEAFVVEQGEDVLERLSLDGYLATWAERRAVVSRVKRRGRTGSRGREQVAKPRAVEERTDTRTSSSSRVSPHEHIVTPTPATATPSRTRRKQRIVELDSAARELVVETEPKGGRVKLALEDALDSPIASVEEPRPTTQSSRKNGNGVSKTVEPIPEPPPFTSEEPPAEGGEELRKRMEALRSEVGDSWLSVLAGQARGSPSPVPTPPPRSGSAGQTQGRQGQGQEVIII